MKGLILAVLFAVLVTQVAVGQVSDQQEILAAIPDSPDATTTCSSTYTTPGSDGFFQWCLTSNGNIAQYKSPNEHLRVGAVLEGYQICDVTPNIGYFDYAQVESGNWKTAILTQPNGVNTFPVTVKRTTADGHFTLTQKFAQDAEKRMVIITMMIKNNTTVAHDVFVYRFADLDINGALVNTFDNGVDSAWGYDSGTFGVHLVLQTNEFGNGAAKYKLSTGVLGACANPSDPDGPITEDGAIYIRALVPLAAKATATVIFNYRTM